MKNSNPLLSMKASGVILALTLSFLTAPMAVADKATTAASVPDIQTLPRLSADLPVGTIAWATISQLHPTQPQTGKREVERKSEKFTKLLPDKDSKFPKDLYAELYTDSVTPVYIGQTPSTDERAGTEQVLGYITDRTHGSNAMAVTIQKQWGKKALSKPILDDKNRPLNFVIVKVIGNLSQKPPQDFAKFMVSHKLGYYKLWSRGPKGETLITPITFEQLPNTVLETTDNPYRGLIGELQHDGKLGRVSTDFSQFIDAQGLVDHNVVTWDDISLDAKDKQYQKAVKAAADFFASPAAKGLPGVQ